jgi:hypothetical protein
MAASDSAPFCWKPATGGRFHVQVDNVIKGNLKSPCRKPLPSQLTFWKVFFRPQGIKHGESSSSTDFNFGHQGVKWLGLGGN